MKKTFTTLALALACFCQGAAQETDSKTVVGGIEFVDMGTSVLWATQPLGVSEERPYGDLYWFGAPAAYPTASYFDIWGMDIEEYGGNPDCDAATAALGSGVLTPSKAHFEELVSACTFTYSRDYSIGRDVLTITSKSTGNRIRIVGAGFCSYGNEHYDYPDLYLYSSTGSPDNNISGYYFNGNTVSSIGAEKAIRLQKGATSNAYQILPVFDKDRVVKAEKIVLNASELKLGVGDKSQLVATVEPAATSNPGVTWITSDAAVATVSSEGEVEALSAGECVITATAIDGSEVSASCALTVVDASSEMAFVDMGLSVLWGEYDLGAKNCEENGIYYAWGTVDNAGDYLSAVEDAYKMIPNGPCTAVERDSSDPTKPYDVATDVLGDKWHTPNQAEWEELIANTTVTRETINNVTMACFTSKINGNKLYMCVSGYLRETSANPSMSGYVIRQTSDAPSDYIYNAKYVIFPGVMDLPRYCFWLIPIRPVSGEPLTGAIDGVTADFDADLQYDIYDVLGRRVSEKTTYTDAVARLNSGIYIFVSPDGRHRKVAI